MSKDTMPSAEALSPIPPKLPLLLVAFTQGLFLLWLHQALRLDVWPATESSWLTAFYTWGLIAPLMLLLGFHYQCRWRVLLAWTLGFSLLAAGLGFYTGSQLLDDLSSGSVMPIYVLSMTVATFKAVMYSQIHANGEKVTYSRLFQLSWRNFLTLSLSLLFTACVWGIFALWAALFEVINIQFFDDLFYKSWFVYPVLGLVHGFGIIIFRSQQQIIDTIRRIQQALMKFLLLFLVLVSLLFLASLPFTGLTPIWETGHGSLLMLTIQGFLLFLLNAVYQDEPSERPCPLWLHRFIYVGVATMPIYSLLVAYGLWARIDQHGLSLLRLWAVLIWAFFTCFSLGYLWGIIKQRDNWLTQLSWINIRVGLAVLVVMLLVNSSLLDFRKLVVNNQMSRLASEVITPDELDIRYFRQNLAKPGKMVLMTLASDLEETHPRVANHIQNSYTGYREPTLSDKASLIDSIQLVNFESLPPDLEPQLKAYADVSSWILRETNQRYLLSVDLNEDGSQEYAFIINDGNYARGCIFVRQGETWDRHELTPDKWNLTDLPGALEAGKWQVESPRWNRLRIGDGLFTVSEME